MSRYDWGHHKTTGIRVYFWDTSEGKPVSMDFDFVAALDDGLLLNHISSDHRSPVFVPFTSIKMVEGRMPYDKPQKR